MRHWTLILALSTSTLGCTDLLGGDKASDDDDDDDDEDDGGEDGGGDSGGGIGGGSGGGGGSACSNIFPLDEVGRTLFYEHENAESGFVGDYSLTNMGQEDFEGEQAWRMDAEYHNEGTTSDYESDAWTSNWYRCDEDGVWILGSTYDSVILNAGSTTEYWSETLYSQPGLNAPRKVSVGDSWSFDYTFVQTDSYGNTNEYSYDIDYDVVGTESITVPAGTYDAFEISYDVDGSEYSYFSADGVGMVLSGDNELVSIED